MKTSSKVDNYTFPYPLSDNASYLAKNKIRGLEKLKFNTKVFLETQKNGKKLKQALLKKKCYYGPFKGEFGHFTAHTMPFLMYLHKAGVEITYCGMELHMPLLVDEKGNSIISDFRPLRDFFAERAPHSNYVIPPEDVQKEIEKFEKEAVNSNLPFWNIGDDFYYWFVHRHWLLKGYTHTYSIDKFYKNKEEYSCVIFPRGKGAKVTHNNGEEWDYQEVIDTIKPYYDKVYVCGHPAQSLAIQEQDGVEIRITTDNAKILQACSNADLILTQHSGVNNLGEYTNTQVLIIYKGGKRVEDIGSMNNTLRFRHGLNQKFPLNFAFSIEEIGNYVKKRTENRGISN